MDAKMMEPAVQTRNGRLEGYAEAPDSLYARLGELGRRVPPSVIADLWLFPPLPDVETSAEFVLFTRILEDGDRALYSARMVPANGAPSHQIVVEHGRAPADRVRNLIAGLQRRLGDPTPARHIAIEGDFQRWEGLLEQMREARAGTGPRGRD